MNGEHNDLTRHSTNR